MLNLSFSPLEETISFYTRNDFAIINHLLVGNDEGLWKYALLAYNDNRNIIDEYERGIRSIDGDYDIKWLNCLKKRLINGLDNEAKKIIIQNAKEDISNILHAMYPTKTDLHLYRTAWIDKTHATENAFPYSREYKALGFGVGSVLEIKSITSCSMTPYREDDDVGSDFYRYEIHIPKGNPVLELDPFECHNEDGEVLLPPMKCKVSGICTDTNGKCRGIIKLAFIQPLEGTVFPERTIL